MKLLTEAAMRLAQHSRLQPSGCIEWTAGCNSDGYGNAHVGGKTRSAHRVAWAVAHQQVPQADLVVRHTCDNPPCVNPHHLVLGTWRIRETAVNAARVRKEKETPKAKLTWGAVRVIRMRLSLGESAVALAREYRVTKATVGKINRNETWRRPT